MKFVFFGYDFSLNIAKRLIADGHTLLALFTFPCDGMFIFNDRTKALARELDAPLYEDRATAGQLQALTGQGCKLFLAAGYPHKIPPVDEKEAYALNVHPALLPAARGIMPLAHILMEAPDAAGLSIHKMTPVFDDGDILYQEPIAVTPETDVEILSAQIAMRSPDAVSGVVRDLARDLARVWENATPQDRTQAYTCPPPDETMRTLDWRQPVETLNRKGRAFGRYGVIAMVQSERFVVFNFKGWKEAHRNTPGDVLLAGPREIVVAVADGYVCLKEFRSLSPAVS